MSMGISSVVVPVLARCWAGPYAYWPQNPKPYSMHEFIKGTTSLHLAQHSWILLGTCPCALASKTCGLPAGRIGQFAALLCSCSNVHLDLHLCGGYSEGCSMVVRWAAGPCCRRRRDPSCSRPDFDVLL